MVRSVLKSQLACLSHWTGAGRLVGAVTGRRGMPLVLGYHRVVDDFAAHSGRSLPAMLISRRMLESHLDWLGRRYRVVSLDELGRRLESGSAAGMASVTFDDGYRDLYENAFPLLKRKGMPAAVFVVTDLMGSSDLQLHDKLYLLLARTLACGRRSRGMRNLCRGLDAHLDPRERAGNGAADPEAVMRRLLIRLSQAELHLLIERMEAENPLEPGASDGMQPLTWSMLGEMQRAGVTVGSHTRSHALLTNESRCRQVEEAAASRESVEERLGTETRHFAYPGGCFDREAVDAVQASGYRFAYTACAHRDPRHPLLTIPRTLLWERSCVDACGRFSAAIMSAHATGLLQLVSGCGAHHGRLPADRPAGRDAS